MTSKRKHDDIAQSAKPIVAKSIAIGIVGSRSFTNAAWFERQLAMILQQWGLVDNALRALSIVSGGAPGVDTLARQYAAAHGLHFVEYCAEWSRYGKRAGPQRNSQIVAACDRLVAFPSRTGRGTQDAIRKAQRAGKPCKVVFID